MNNSSFFWTLALIVSIMALASLAIVDVESGVVRDTFSKKISISELKNRTTPQENIEKKEDIIEKDEDLVEKILSEGGYEKTALPSVKDSSEIKFDENNFEKNPLNSEIENSKLQFGRNLEDLKSQSPNFDSDRPISTELLHEAGFEVFSIKIRPFDGNLLGIIKTEEISQENVTVYSIESPVFERIVIYQIKADNLEESGEIFDYIKAKSAQVLGVKLNQNNQFGLASFYINFEIAKNDVFLVVKYESVVYALSYPRQPDEENTIHSLVEKLLKII